MLMGKVCSYCNCNCIIANLVGIVKSSCDGMIIVYVNSAISTETSQWSSWSAHPSKSAPSTLHPAGFDHENIEPIVVDDCVRHVIIMSLLSFLVCCTV